MLGIFNSKVILELAVLKFLDSNSEPEAGRKHLICFCRNNKLNYLQDMSYPIDLSPAVSTQQGSEGMVYRRGKMLMKKLERLGIGIMPKSSKC